MRLPLAILAFLAAGACAANGCRGARFTFHADRGTAVAGDGSFAFGPVHGRFSRDGRSVSGTVGSDCGAATPAFSARRVGPALGCDAAFGRGDFAAGCVSAHRRHLEIVFRALSA